MSKSFNEAHSELNYELRRLGRAIAEVWHLPQFVAWLNRKLS